MSGPSRKPEHFKWREQAKQYMAYVAAGDFESALRFSNLFKRRDKLMRAVKEMNAN